MKGDFADQFEAPKIEPDEDQPKRVYVCESDIRRHGLTFLVIAAIIILIFWVVIGSYLVGPRSRACGIANCCAASEGLMFFIVILASATGAAIHAITSFVTFVGNRLLIQSWLWWLYLRIPIGVLLGTLVYLGIRAGAFGSYNFQNCTDTFLVALITGLSGLFSKQVTDKLSDLVDSFLVAARPPVRKDSLEEDVDKGEAQAPTPLALPPIQAEETVHHAQRLLVELGYLRAETAEEKPSADGILGPKTRAAIESFLKAESIAGETRRATLGEETDPDFWPNLIGFLEKAAELKVKEG